MAKPKANKNKAKDVEVMNIQGRNIEMLWADYGKLSAHRENLNIQQQQTTNQMAQIYARIMEITNAKQRENPPQD